MFTSELFDKFARRYKSVRIVHGRSRAAATHGRRIATCHVGDRRYVVTEDSHIGTEVLLGAAIGTWLRNCPVFVEGCKELHTECCGLQFFDKHNFPHKTYIPGCSVHIDISAGFPVILHLFQAVTGGTLVQGTRNAGEEVYHIKRK